MRIKSFLFDKDWNISTTWFWWIVEEGGLSKCYMTGLQKRDLF